MNIKEKKQFLGDFTFQCKGFLLAKIMRDLNYYLSCKNILKIV